MECELAAQPSLVTGVRAGRRPALEAHGRFQHALLLGSVFVLAATGLPQKLNSLGPSRWLMDAAGGIETLRAVHHAAGAVLIVAALYHLSLLLVAVRANRGATPLVMIPDARDYFNAAATLLYFAGLRRERPLLRAPTYFQKLDYWVLAWGLPVMALTGLARLFPATASRLLSGDPVAAALEAHTDLAVLAVVWIAVVHVAYGALTPPSTGERRPGAPQRETREGSVESRE